MEVLSQMGVNLSSGMPVISGSKTKSNLSILTAHPRHISPTAKLNDPDRVSEGFADALKIALRNVEEQDNKAQQLTARAVYAPDSVDVHTLVLAAEKANFSLTLTKTLADGIVRAFRELSTPR